MANRMNSAIRAAVALMDANVFWVWPDVNVLDSNGETMRRTNDGRSFSLVRAATVFSGVVVMLFATTVDAKADVRPAGLERGMSVQGFDAEVASSNGYEIVELPGGALTSVPKDDAAAVRAGTKAPSGAVYQPRGTGPGLRDFDSEPGECGDAYVYLWAQGGGQATMGTGFIVRPDWPVVQYINWRVRINDRGGESTQSGYSYSGGHAFRAPERWLSLTRGPARATVPWYSIVVLRNGTICYSLEPSAPEDIT